MTHTHTFYMNNKIVECTYNVHPYIYPLYNLLHVLFIVYNIYVEWNL